MVFRVHDEGGEFRIVLSPEAMAELDLKPGSGVELRKVDLDAHEGHEFASVEDVLRIAAALQQTHAKTFRELAKGPGAP